MKFALMQGMVIGVTVAVQQPEDAPDQQTDKTNLNNIY